MPLYESANAFIAGDKCIHLQRQTRSSPEINAFVSGDERMQNMFALYLVSDQYAFALYLVSDQYCIGMAVCRQDILHKHYISNPIPTSVFCIKVLVQVIS